MYIYMFIDSGFFREGEGVDVILTICYSVIELLCGKTTSDTDNYSKQSIFICVKTCLEEIFKQISPKIPPNMDVFLGAFWWSVGVLWWVA